MQNKEACLKLMMERFQFLFEEDLIKEMCALGMMQLYQTDDILIEVGSSLTHIPFIVDGSIKISTEDDNGDGLLLYYIEVGDTCAVTLDCCSKKNYKSKIKAVALEETQILFFPKECMDQWMVKYSSWRAYVLESFNTRLNEMVMALDNVLFHSLEERLDKYLKEKMIMNNSKVIHISHQEIANDLNSSRVVISRLLKKKEQESRLSLSRNRITIK